MNIVKLSKLLNNGLFYLILFLFAFIPLYPKFPLFNVEGTFVAVRIEDFLIALTLGGWLVYLVISKKWQFLIKETYGRALLLFFLIGVMSVVSAIFLTSTTLPHLGALHFFRRVELMLLLPACATVVTTKKRLIGVLVILFLSLVAVNVFGLGQKYLDWPVVSTTNSEFSKGTILKLTPGARVNSTFAGHYDLAVFLSAALVFLTVFFFTFGKLWKLVLFILGAISLFVLILTAARVSFVAAFIGLVFALIFAKKKKYLFLVALCLVVILAYPSQLRDRFVSTVTVNLLNLGTRYEGRNINQQLENKLNIPTLYYRMAARSSTGSAFASPSGTLPTDIAPGEPTDATELGVYRSFQIRLNMEWPTAIRAFLKNPFLGTGYASLGLATDNDFLRMLGEIGFLGTISFFLLLLAVWKKIAKGLKESDKVIRFFSVGTLSLIVIFLANGLFIDVFEASKVASLFWMLLGVNLAILNKKETE
jgi:hypothetical protein